MAKIRGDVFPILNKKAQRRAYLHGCVLDMFGYLLWKQKRNGEKRKMCWATAYPMSGGFNFLLVRDRYHFPSIRKDDYLVVHRFTGIVANDLDCEFRLTISLRNLARVLLVWGTRVCRERATNELTRLSSVPPWNDHVFLRLVGGLLTSSDLAKAAIALRAVCRCYER